MPNGSPMLISDTEISGVLKTVYSGYREKVFPISTPLLANVKKGGPGGLRNMRWGGAGVNFNAVLSRPVGLVASSNGYFGKHAQAQEKQGTMDIKRVYVTREIDGLAIVGTQSKEAAYIALAKKILDEAKDAATLGMQEILHGDGRGIKALVGTRTSDTVYIVDSPYGIASAGQGGLGLDQGMYIAILDTSASDAVLGRAIISSVANSGDNCTITLATAITGVAATDKIVLCTASDTAYNANPNGLTNILNRGGSYDSLHSLAATTYPRWDSTRLVAGTDTPDAAQPTEQDIWELMARVAGRSGFDAKMKPSDFLLMTTPGIEKKLADQYFGQRRLTQDDFVQIKGGFKAITICGVPLVSDFWCPAGVVYLLHKNSLTWITAKDFGQIEYESAGAFRFISGQDAYQVNWGEYMNFGTVNRLAHGMISGYTDTARYTHVI